MELRLGPARQFVTASDQAGAPLVREIGPCPLDHHDETIAEPDQEKNVDEQPRQPGEISRQFELAQLGDGGGAADRGQAAFVVIVKIASRLMLQVASDGFCDPVPLLDGDRRDSGEHLAVFVRECGQVAENKYFPVPGNAEIGLDEHAASAVDGHTQLSAEWRSGHTRCPQHHRGWNLFVAHPNRAGLNARDHVRSADLDSQASQLVFGFAGELFGICSQNTGSALDEQDAALPRIDTAKLVVHGVVRDFSQGSCKFDAGGASSDHHKLQQKRCWTIGGLFCGLVISLASSSLVSSLALGQFEGQQNAAADFESVFDGLQTGRQRLPFRVAKVSMGGAGGDDQEVVIQCLPTRSNLLLLQIEIKHFFKQHFNIGVGPKYPPDGRCDFAGRQAGGSDLIEQRLESVVISPVNDRDLNREAGDPASGGQARETSPHDYYSRSGLALHLSFLLPCLLPHLSPTIEIRRMAITSKIIADSVAPVSAPNLWLRALEVPFAYRRYFTWFQVIVAYVFIERALWSSRLVFRNTWGVIAVITVFVFAVVDRPSLRRMGLSLPTSFGSGLVLAVSLAAALFLVFAVRWAGGQIPANPTWPNLHATWEYLAWALIQEFMLQSFFFTRCEELFGSSAAVWIAATLFAAAHVPSPILTTFTLVGGLFFCEMFRRYRSIYAIGIVHAVLGLTVAVTMPDSVLHSMRVGIGYLRY